MKVTTTGLFHKMIDKNSKIVISGVNGSVGKLLFNKLEKEDFLVEKLDLNDLNNKDIFIHLAAKTSNTQEILDSNISYLKECIEYCKKTNIKNFIFFSTMSVYGNINQEDVNEQTSFSNTPNIYGLSKLLGEELLKESGLNVLILRLPAILTKNTTNTFIYKLYEKLSNNEDITITNYNKTFTNIIDINSIYDFIFTYDFKSKNETFVLGIKKEKTLKEVVEFLKKELNSKSNIVLNDNISNFYNIDNSKAIKYGFKQRDIKEVLKEWINLLRA
ncbi:SDR family oxidoreductase [Arcobacter sp. YIC-464]|uniref:SDR family oxidoreductase n=1 Tax=Arcobacter sp. YIC-464 TaxID=3376631 RepID=UPI003C17EA70